MTSFLRVDLQMAAIGKRRTMANIHICPQISVFALISVFAPELNNRHRRSGLKVQGKMLHKDMLIIVFQSN
jgi:hypothetical protein